ncbi:protein CHLOROPLAST IMPORT APPARATUS 2-like [Euphorbia lathyris]|uniref:protein CHLOROPLAST IMPORT APPARATUS 2-like n=1 Tax=Euphorbia lathyris TaxID=212925 RepID=UPI0033140931
MWQYKVVLQILFQSSLLTLVNMSSKSKRKKNNPARKSRSKRRKPKYLSLKLELSPKIIMSPKQQLNLFPLHPENILQDKYDDQVSDHVAFLFETATDTSTSLHGILDLDSATTTTTTTTTSEDAAAYDRDDQKLVKTAMKRKERDASEDRWVSYWEVVEKKDQEEVSSCSYSEKKGLVGLKLDYEHILNVWSDKAPLYINGLGDSPQTVPDLLQLHHSTGIEGGNLWKVPEIEMEKEKVGKREASVLRYKEKRQNRLFAKRIRYQVRKLNAEKRPRLKGRFVKRNGED